MSERVRFGSKNGEPLFVDIEPTDTTSTIQAKVNEAIVAASRPAGLVRIEPWVERNSKGIARTES